MPRYTTRAIHCVISGISGHLRDACARRTGSEIGLRGRRKSTEHQDAMMVVRALGLVCSPTTISEFASEMVVFR